MNAVATTTPPEPDLAVLDTRQHAEAAQAAAFVTPPGDGSAGRHWQEIVKRSEAVDWLVSHGLASKWPVEAPPRPEPEPTPTRTYAKPIRVLGLVGSRSDPLPEPRPVLVRLCDVEEQPVSWLMPGRFPRGEVSTILGEPGVGKSTFVGWLASIVSRGGLWPCGTPCEAGSVVFLQAEERVARMVRPRIRAMGGDTTRIHMLTSVIRTLSEEELPFSIARDCDVLAQAIDRIGDVKLILIDPVGEFIKGISGFNEIETREAIAPLFKLAEKKDIAVVLVVHPNKDTEKSIAMRVGGSLAFLAKSRAAWFLSKDPRDKTRKRRLLSHIKSNCDGIVETAVAMSLVRKRLVWIPEKVDLDAEQVENLIQRQRREDRANPTEGPRRGRSAKEVKRAAEFLLELLQSGPVVQIEAMDLAEEEGIKPATFRRAVKRVLDPADGRVQEFREEGDRRVWLRLADPPASAQIELAPIS